MKIHLQGIISTICGRDAVEVATVYTIKDVKNKGDICKICEKYAKDFQRENRKEG